MNLTKKMRSEITAKLIERKFKPIMRDFVNRMSVAAIAEHGRQFGDDLEKMNALPDGWLPTHYSFSSFHFRDNYYAVNFNGIVNYRNDDKNITVAYAPELRQIRLRHLTKFPALPIIGKEIKELIKELADLIEQHKNETRELELTLVPFTTAEKLIEHWPEVAPYIPEYTPPIKNLPALPLDELNKKFGL